MSSSSSTATVGVIGLGAMGLRLAAHLVQAGVAVHAFDASPGARERAGAAGVVVTDAAADLVGRDVVILSLPTPAIVRTVLAELVGTGQATGTSLTVLDTSTIGPADAREFAAVAEQHGCRYADAPILGRPGSVGSWTFPVGGEPDVVALAARVLEPVAKKVVGTGAVGTAAATKVLNNLMLGAINAITAEVLVLAEASGLDPGTWVDVIVDSGAASVSPLFRDVAVRAVEGDFDPVFSLRLMHKDNALALTLADELAVPMPTGRATQVLNTMGMAAGHGDEDSIAVVKALESLTGVRARRHDDHQ